MNTQGYNEVTLLPDFIKLQKLDEVKQEYFNGLAFTDAVVKASNIEGNSEALSQWINDVQVEKMNLFNQNMEV